MFEKLRMLCAAFDQPLGRVLCFHPESDSLFEHPYFHEFDGLVSDVTGVEWAERRWREQGE